MKKKLLLALSLIAILTVLFAISVSAQDPVKTWDISKTSSDKVSAYLYYDPANTVYYTLTISGTGNMKNWDSSSAVPWYSSYRSRITSVTIENGVTSIGSYAFSGCTSLTNVVIGDGVTSIGDSAFLSCDSLTSVVIPDSVTSIGKYAFERCTSLTSVVIGDSVTSIGGSAFAFCDSLTSVVIPDSVTSIGERAFYSCYSLTSVVIPDSVTSIGESAFYYCPSLTSVVIGDSVTSIGNDAFEYCDSLTSVVIPDSVTSIGSSAFAYCDALTIYCEAMSKPSGWKSSWNMSDRPVVWGYFDEEACLESVFTFKGYSFGFAGQIAVGFDIDYEAIAKYEAKTGKTLEIGVVFAGYDNLGGKQPLDQNGQGIELSVGRVSKADLTGFGYSSYDFVLTDVVDSIKDVKLVIAAYIFDGENVKYVQENGLSDTVSGISYNEAKESVEE